MKKILFLTPLLFASVFLLGRGAAAETQVGGELQHSTTWTKADSPYLAVKTVVIPKTVTLTIEPGVTISMPGEFDMFSVKGKIIASGTPEDRIVFDGGGNSTFFNALSSTNLTLVDLNYCEFENGLALWQNGFGSFNLRHSTVTNLAESSYLYFPVNDIYIEYNEFKDAGGFSISQGGDNQIYIRYNLFNGKNAALPATDDFYIQNVASLENSATIVADNSFLNIAGPAVALAPGQVQAKLAVPNNYWGTTDTSAIEDMIYDQNDNSACAGTIDYTPILAAPDPQTPDIARPAAPTIDPVTTPTDSPEQAVSGAKPVDTSVWFNGEEIVPLNEDTIWSYMFSLTLGENDISVTVKDGSGVESLPATTVITRSETVCTSWTYSDWGVCVNGQQTRTVLSSLPADCVGGEPVLTQSCSTVTAVDVVAEEKALVTTVNNALAKRLSGRILLQVEKNGEAWYVYPVDLKKYYLGRPADAFNVMRKLGLGATHEFISSYVIFPTSVLGRILLDVEQHGEAYYINPVDKKAYYLGRPQDAFDLMRSLGLGITNANLRQIAVGELK